MGRLFATVLRTAVGYSIVDIVTSVGRKKIMRLFTGVCQTVYATLPSNIKEDVI